MSSIHDKARRLLTGGAVSEIEGVRLFHVEGDSADYVVTVREGRPLPSCTCPAGEKSYACSHSVAVDFFIREEEAAAGEVRAA